MRAVLSMDVHVEAAHLDAAALSFGCIFDTLDASEALRETIVDLFPDLFNRGGDGAIEFIAEPISLCAVDFVVSPASGAVRRYGVSVLPGERYLELFAAVAVDCDVGTAHGWPILSVVARTNTVAEAGPAASGTGGGQEA